jgi:S1-C subfamily serine protease
MTAAWTVKETRVLFAAVLTALACMAISTTAQADGRAWLGIWMGAETQHSSSFERSEKEIVYIVTVDHGGPAEAAGLLRLDVILEIEGQPVRNMREVVCLVRAARPGQTILLAIQRRTEVLAIPATLAGWPADGSVYFNLDCPALETS